MDLGARLIKLLGVVGLEAWGNGEDRTVGRTVR